MEAVVRKPFQGVYNIIRFNWHFYVFASLLVSVLLVGASYSSAYLPLFIALLLAIILPTIVSLGVSYYVYDYSALYNFTWLEQISTPNQKTIANIHAGFDETSAILLSKFPTAQLSVYDFYDPEKHTEISIERARKAYEPFQGTIKINTGSLPIKANSIDLLFNIFALHEIRDLEERVRFLTIQKDALTEDGRCIVVEHLRDLPNFLAYNIGFFHFLSANQWHVTFERAGMQIEKTIKINPFVSVFVLKAS